MGKKQKSVKFEYANQFNPDTGEPVEKHTGGLFVDIAPDATHSDAILEAVRQLPQMPFTGDERVVSITVRLDDKPRYYRYEFEDSNSYSVEDLQNQPGIIRRNMVDTAHGKYAEQIDE